MTKQTITITREQLIKFRDLLHSAASINRDFLRAVPTRAKNPTDNYVERFTAGANLAAEMLGSKTEIVPLLKVSRETAKAVAELCADAYSFDRYASWPEVARVLLQRGYTQRQTEAIMRSKWMRWAADNMNRYDSIPARAIIEFIDNMIAKRGAESVQREVEELVAETFGGEPCGVCEANPMLGQRCECAS